MCQMLNQPFQDQEILSSQERQQNSKAAVSGSGDVEAYDLKTEKAELKIAGSGSIGISVEKEIVARVSGSGDIKYKGQPRIEDIKVSGSGRVSSY